MKRQIIPITLITGYLGAGKTTLLNSVLENQKGYKVAVIVNDIGEVNIDASLIQKEGQVDNSDGSLVPLSNGCICCTLKMDLVKQIINIYAMHKFDYIVIEASGVCEPIPIAQTITMIDGTNDELPEICRLDNLVAVVDAKRMADEFCNGQKLLDKDIEEDDVENLLVQQIEFCNKIIINKTDKVTPEELDTIIHVIKALQPKAEIIKTSFAKVEPEQILNTRSFNYQRAQLSAGWVQALAERENEEKECETDEYGIGTFVYEQVKPFSQVKFEDFTGKHYPDSIIRTKGSVWFKTIPDTAFIFEQSGKLITLDIMGKWIASSSKAQVARYLSQHPGEKWDKEYGDRINRIVIIGKDMDKDEIINGLNSCLA